MRSTLLSAAIALGLASTALPAAAQTVTADELAALKAQIQALQEKVAELEERSDAQSGVNIDTAGQLDKLTTGSTKVDTKGGIKVASADGNFEASIGARLHLDGYLFDTDQAASTSTTDVRRARLTLAGKAMGWDYKFEQDFVGGNTTDGFREVWVAREALGGKWTIGHFKPYRSIDELTSSNDLLMMERPFASATGLFSGRQFVQGIGFQRGRDNYTVAASVFNTRNAGAPRNEGVGAAARATWAPINNDNNTLHFGASYSLENANEGTANLVAVAPYAGRRGPSQTIATTTGASGDSVTATAVEAAGSFGPWFFQSEYSRAVYGRPAGDHDVDTFYVMGGWLVNGGHRGYKSAVGFFGGPKVTDKGLWELTARYDTIENRDVANLAANSMTLGVNYYVNANVRLMFNYTQGENEFNGDETAQYAVRTQLAF